MAKENSNDLNSGGEEDSIVLDKNSADNSDSEGEYSFIATATKCLECRMNKLDNETNTKIYKLGKEISSFKEAESTCQSNSAGYILYHP